MESALKFLQENENLIESNSFDDFFESDEFNDLDDDTKREVFYLKTFYMSTQEYSSLENCIDDFIKITSDIKEKDYLQNIHECYQALICNYLNNIDDLLKPCFNNDEGDFIDNFHTFVDYLNDKDLFYPNDTCKKNIINELKNVQYDIGGFKRRIKNENVTKFNRYSEKLNKYIEKCENYGNDNIDIKSSINDFNNLEEINNQKNENDNNKINDEIDIKQKNNLKNSINIESLLNDDDDQLINNIDEYIKKENINEELNRDKKEYSNKDINKDNINNNNNNNININNNLNLNTINNINLSNNNIRESDNQEFKIIYNKSRIVDNRNSLNNSENYHDSMIGEFSLSNIINEIVNSENKELEEEKVQEIFDEIDNFTNVIAPMFDSNNNNNQDFTYLKKMYLKQDNISENKNNIIINNFQNINIDSNNNININSVNKPKKKKKGKKKKIIKSNNIENQSNFN